MSTSLDDALCRVREVRTLREAEANARLIVSAPELLALAIRVSRLNDGVGEIGAGMLASLVADARRLVLKAHV